MNTSALAPKYIGLGVVLLAGLVSSLPPRVAAAEWEYQSMAGITATCIEFDPVHRRIYVGTIEGFHILDLATGVWEEYDEEGWIGRTVWSIAGHDGVPNRVITGRENAFFKGYLEVSETLDENGTITYNSEGGSVTGIARDPADVDRYHASTWSDIAPGEYVRSTDGGLSWALTTGTHQFAMTDVAVDDLGVVYLSGDAPISRSTDGGSTWNVAADGLPPGLGSYFVEVARGTVAAEGRDWDTRDRGTRDQGTRDRGNRDRGTRDRGNRDQGNRSRAVVDPIALTSNDAGVYSSTDRGTTWTPELAVACRNLDLAEDSGTFNTNFQATAAFDGRIFLSAGPGSPWEDETGSLDAVTPIDLVFAEGYLWVATAGDGVFRTPVPGDPSTTPPLSHPGLQFVVGPNPFQGRTDLRFTLVSDTHVRIEVHDMMGRRVATLLDSPRPTGAHRVEWDAQNLPTGVYTVRLVTPQGEIVRRVTQIR